MQIIRLPFAQKKWHVLGFGVRNAVLGIVDSTQIQESPSFIGCWEHSIDCQSVSKSYYNFVFIKFFLNWLAKGLQSSNIYILKYMLYVKYLLDIC